MEGSKPGLSVPSPGTDADSSEEGWNTDVPAQRWRLLPAGLIDAGFASLGTFGVGLTATLVLSDPQLGGYAIVFSAFLLASVLPAQLILTPLEVDTVSYPSEERLMRLRATVALGARVSLPASGLVLLSLLAAPKGLAAGSLAPLCVGAALCVVVSPLQDHVRRMHHIANRSWLAAATSIVQFSGVVIAAVTLSKLRVDGRWIPFGALGLANVVSLTVGILVSRTPDTIHNLPRFSAFAKRGSWYLLAGMTGPGVGFLANTTVGALIGAASLGYAEGARIVAQPVLVSCMGLSAVLGPRSIEAAAHSDVRRARRISRSYALLSTGAVICAAVLAGWSWGWNPLVGLVPSAYVVAGLAMVSLAANLPNCIVMAYRSELMGARREAQLAKAEIVGGAARIASAATAALTGAFSVPLGFAALGVTRWVLYTRSLRKHYAVRRPAPEPHTLFSSE